MTHARPLCREAPEQAAGGRGGAQRGATGSGSLVPVLGPGAWEIELLDPATEGLGGGGERNEGGSLAGFLQLPSTQRGSVPGVRLLPRGLTSSPANPPGPYCLSSPSPESGPPLGALGGGRAVFHPEVWSRAGGEAGLPAEGRR